MGRPALFSPLSCSLTFCPTFKKEKERKMTLSSILLSVLYSRVLSSQNQPRCHLLLPKSLNLISGTMCARFAKFEP